MDNQEHDMPRNLGAVYTPPEFARLQIEWVIRTPQDTLLDIGVGEGEFTLTAHQRLVELGTESETAQRQIYGAEIHRPAYNRFTELAARAGLLFPNVYPLDFFEADFPVVDGVTGNLPFVRRSLIDDVEVIRQCVLDDSQGLDETEISRLSDLYIYCLLRGASFLKEGGRLAVITSDSWLNAKYGLALKSYLQKNFKVEGLVSFDRQIFDAEVKSVLMFATKKAPTRGPRNIHFIRVKNGLPAGYVLQVLKKPKTPKPDVEVVTVKARDLDPHSHWGAHFKSPDVCEEIASHNLMISMSEVAQTSLGIQTLAKDFFVLSPARARQWQIEEEYLVPLAQSPRNFTSPIIQPVAEPSFYLFYCSKNKEELRGTNALRYIEAGESAIVPVRGKGISVVGYQNKERIKEAKRPIWYDMRSQLDRRAHAEILIPRLIYRTFRVLWNRAKFAPGELFIEFKPWNDNEADTTVYLAILTSSVTELMLRAQAQLYGGGTYNVSPGDIGDVPILNVAQLSERQKHLLRDVFRYSDCHTPPPVYQIIA